MKCKVIYAALAVVVLLVVTDARKTSGTRNRGSSGSRGTTSRGKGNTHQSSAPPVSSHSGFSQPRPGVGSSQPKPVPKPQPAGWNVKETAVHKDVSNTQQAAYPKTSTGLSGSGGNAQGGHNYPPSGAGGLSGNSPIQQSHTYPSNAQPGQQSGATNNLHALSYAPNNQQIPTYPNGGGLSGHGVSAPSSYPQHVGAAPVYQGTHQGASNYPGHQGIHQGAPPAYTGGVANTHPNSYPVQAGAVHPMNNVGQHVPAYSGYGGVGNGYHGGYGGPGGFSSYNAYGGGNKGSTALKGLGVAGAGAGTLLAGLALWNIARSTSGGGGGSRHTQHNVYNTYNTYNNETHAGPGTPSHSGPNAPAIDPVLGELVNCTLTVSATNSTEVLAIPCNIATSVASANHEKLPEGTGAETKCIVTVVNTNGTEFTTSIPCSTLTGLAEKAFPQPEVNCTLAAGLTPDPINPCMPLEGDMTVIPLPAAPQGSTPQPAPAIESSPAPNTTAPAA